MRTRCILASLVLAVPLAAVAQYRDAYPAVITPALKPAPAELPDAAGDLARTYERAGRPKVALLWNQRLSDRTHAPRVDKSVTREFGKSSMSASEKSTSGSSGAGTLRDEDRQHDKTTVVTQERHALEEPVRTIELGPRDAAAIERAFVAEMSRAGLQFVDRALAMRRTAALEQRQGADRQLLEIDALLAHAQWVMEVLWIKDASAPAGYAFDVQIKRLVDGTLVASTLSRGMPALVPTPGRWVAGPSGYEFKPPPAPGGATPRQVGTALAQDVMSAVVQQLQVGLAGASR